MDEHSLRTALTDVMHSTPTPPAMDGDRVLLAARHSKRAHRARVAGVGSAVAVVIVAAGAFTLPVLGGGVADSVAVGTAPTGTSTNTSVTRPTGTRQPTDTKPVLPPGQTDRTQTSGPEADRGQQLLKQLLTAIPKGYTAPEKVSGSGGIPAQDHQAQVADNEAKVWEYMASVAVGKGGNLGRLTAASLHFGQGAYGCGVRVQDDSRAKECTTVEVDGKRVTVYTADSGNTQWATYLHPDGIVVTVTQEQAFPGLKPLTDYPFTPEQLAALAIDPRFTLR
ncbi:hypothetical protein JOD54_000767 [Actinokineospora baliensis]|uniref:hypothetical protein n=1 Tax=Actinokineospora baliensis TaxID=547056 RepID=UPI00195866AA|nr:hypothetical protein [Actinokineospora baliensis]MBM7770563.1 hypothetical protein [Actinokineospora baliensis]